jgi:hypothetical protein
MSLFEATSTALIKLAVESLASAPHYTQAEKKTRTEAVVCAIMAFLPFEPVQTMLASQAVGHHFTLMDTFREINNRAMPDTLSVRMRMVTSMQTRMTLALVKELRVVRKEALAVAEADRAVGAPVAQGPEAATPLAPMVESTRPEPPSAGEPTADDATFKAHILAFQEALAATQATLEEARALDKPTAARANSHLEKPALAAAAHARASG